MGRRPARLLGNVSQFLSAADRVTTIVAGAFFSHYSMQLVLPGIPTRTGCRNVCETSINALQGAPRAVTPRPHAALEVIDDQRHIGLRVLSVIRDLAAHRGSVQHVLAPVQESLVHRELKGRVAACPSRRRSTYGSP